ncbi:MAG: phosphotransferase [Actinomycetota bacterium]
MPDPSAHRLEPALESAVLAATGASAITGSAGVQQLWSGYGQIVRCLLADAAMPSVIVKHVRWPDERHHPRGWTTDRSHERKVRSYRVETHWYDAFAERCTPSSRVPRCLAIETHDDEVLMVLEDLDAAGFAGRRTQVTDLELDACLRWLASFHATFLGRQADGLWSTGTYWHLATRPDELDALPDGPLKSAAAEIDRRLSATRFPTIVHGDAKLANFCFTDDGDRAAAVDFQYVGGGCGMKDLAYFVGSCFDEDECDERVPAVLDRYFEMLRVDVVSGGSGVDIDALEGEWRDLFPLAWTDFTRFLQGWSPGHWKLHGYSRRVADEVLASLENTEPPWN